MWFGAEQPEVLEVVQASHKVPRSAITLVLPVCAALALCGGDPSFYSLRTISLRQSFVTSSTNDVEIPFDPTKLWECLQRSPPSV